MRLLTFFNRVFVYVGYMSSNLWDTFPPYNVFEGILKGKDGDSDGRTYLILASHRIEVDQTTFAKLVLGERLRVRSTRKHRAINIDRFLSSDKMT